MLIPSQWEMVFLQSKSFFSCIDPPVQLEFPEEQEKLKKKRGVGGGLEGDRNPGMLLKQLTPFKNKPCININLTPNSKIKKQLERRLIQKAVYKLKKN